MESREGMNCAVTFFSLLSYYIYTARILFINCPYKIKNKKEITKLI